jgi:hypothetical protein
MRRLSHFFGKLRTRKSKTAHQCPGRLGSRPSPKELESKGIMEKDAEEDKGHKKKHKENRLSETEKDEKVHHPIEQPAVTFQEPNKPKEQDSSLVARDSPTKTSTLSAVEEKKQKRKSFIFKFA